MNIKDDADIQILGALTNLLVIRGDASLDLATLTQALRADWQAIGAPLPPAGFEIPALAQNIPAECTDPALTQAVADLQELADATSDALSFQAYVQSVVEDACGTEHLAVIADLEQKIINANLAKAAALEIVYNDFGTEDQSPELFAAFLEGNYAVDVNEGYTGPSPLQNDKPVVPEDCEGAVADYNDQIDAMAGVLKLLEDEIDYLPKNFCSALDEEIQTTLTENANASFAPASESVLILQDLAAVLQAEGQTLEEFQLATFT